ncbi:MAG: hypothetical protein ACI9GW_002890 [Halieaceae bacterium]|jgi:hypothetical protein
MQRSLPLSKKLFNTHVLALRLTHSRRLLAALSLIHILAAMAIWSTDFSVGIKVVLILLCALSAIINYHQYYLCSLSGAVRSARLQGGQWLLETGDGAYYSYPRCTVIQLGFCVLLRWTRTKQLATRTALVASDAASQQDYRRLLILMRGR